MTNRNHRVNLILAVALLVSLLTQATPAVSAMTSVAQVLSWKSSAIWTGNQTGPSDANGRAWYAPDFDDSVWGSVALPDQGFDINANDRYYRAHFDWDGSSAVTLSFVSDDGLSVYINGIALGSWGNGWRQSGCVNNGPPICVNSLTVAPQTVPTSSLRLGDNVIAIDVWNAQACCFHHFNPALTLKRADQPPLVMVHGFNGFDFKPGDCPQADPDSYFEQVDEYLEEAGLKVFSAKLTSSRCYTPPLQDNVKNLMTAIGEAISTTGQSKVILVTHSMGGLVARAYIEGKQYRDDVAAVFTFGSPHWGIPSEAFVYQFVKYFGVKGGVVGAIALGLFCYGPQSKPKQPAICDFSTTGMVLFNFHNRPRGDVPYYFVSGEAPDFGRNILGRITGYLVPGPDDGIVPTLSGQGIGLPGPIRRLATEELHSTVFADASAGYSTYFINTTGAKTNSYVACIARVLMNKQDCGVAITGASMAYSPEQSQLMMDRARQTDVSRRTQVAYGALVAGQTVTREIVSEGGSVTFAAMWQAGAVSVTLISPQGQIIDPAYAAANPTVATYAASEDVATYALTATTPGVWQLILQPQNALADAATFATFATFEQGATLSGEIDRLWHAPGATAILTASLAGVTGAASDIAVKANILRADGVTESVTMTQVAPGLYIASYLVPPVPGYAEMHFVASGKTSGGVPFEREANLTFQISPVTAGLAGSFSEATEPRAKGLPLYQALTLTVGISSTADTVLGLSADLVDQAGNFVAHSLVTQKVSAGPTGLSLRFEGDDIAASRRDGPYRLTNVLLTDQSGALMALAQAQNVYSTSAYRFVDFEVPQSVYLPWVQKAP